MLRKELSSTTSSRPQITWNIPRNYLERKFDLSHDICGTLVIDIDGTLTVPGKKYEIDPEAIKVLSEFNHRGGYEIFNTGATLRRIERSVLDPLFKKLDNSQGFQKAHKNFKRIAVLPENGSAVLLSRDIDVYENELYFDWFRLHELHVPQKPLLRSLIESELVPQFQGSFLAGDHPEDPLQRDYIISWKNVNNTLELVDHIRADITPKHPEIQWDLIDLKAARTTVDFVHADSGKTLSTSFVLREMTGLAGPVLGFGDLGDEFAEVVPTINVNQLKPNEFRRRGMPAMDLCGPWIPLQERSYVVLGNGPKAKVRRLEDDGEIHVLRDENGEIIFTAEDENGRLTPTHRDNGKPVEITPMMVRGKDGKEKIGDAGRGTSWAIKKLMDTGYFDLR